MAGKADKELTLGILFTARADDTLERMDKKIAASLKKAQGALNKYASGLRNVDKASRQLSKTKNDMNKQIGKLTGAWNRLKGAMKVTVSYGIAATAIYSVTNAMREGIVEIMEYDQALKNLQAITQATDMEIEGMASEMRQLARDTKFSSREVADGMVLLGQAGFTAAEVIDSIGAVSDLATGTLSKMATTTDLLTTTIRAFMLDASESTRAVDVMASAINRSKLTIDKLRTAFNFVGAAAAQTGLSLEDTAATMMVLANNGLRASTIGTGMRQVLSRLLAPSAKLRDAFDQHGIALEKVNPRLVGYKKAIANLAPLIWDNKKQVVDMAKAYELFGLRGAQAAAVIVKSFVTGEWDQMIEKVYDVGAASRMAAKQQEGLAVKWKNFMDRVKNIALAIGDAGLTGAMGKLIDMMKQIATAIELWVREWGNVTFKIVALTIATSVLIRTFTALRLAMITMGPVMVAMRGGFAALTAGSFTLAGAIHGLRAAYLALLAIMGPWGLALATAGVALTAYYAITKVWNKNVGESLPLLRRQGLLLQQQASKIANAREQLAILEDKYGDTVEESHEYNAIIQRLIQSHPKLATEIDAVVDSYHELDRAMEKIQGRVEENVWLNWARRIRSQFFIVENEIGSLTGRVREALLEMSPDDIATSQFSEKAKQSLLAIKDILTDVAQSMADATKAGRETQESIFTKVEKMFEGSPTGILLLKEYMQLLKEANKEDVNFLKSDDTKKARKARLDSDRQYYSMIARWRNDSVLKEEASHQQNLNNIEKWAIKRLEIAKGNNARMRALRDKERSLINIEDLRHETKLIQIEKDRKLERAEWNYKQAQAEIANEYSLKSDAEKKLFNLEQSQAQAQREFQAVKIEILNTYIENLKAKYAEESDVIKAAEMERDNMIAEGEIKLLKSDTKGNKARIVQYNKHLQEMLNETDKKTDQWLWVLKEARDADLISQQEYNDQMMAATGSWIDNFTLGLQRSEEALKSWGEVFQEIGTDINDVFASGLTQGIWDFIDGTKTAEEAFQDFAQGMLKWLGEIILKQTILNALQAIGGFGGTGGGGGATPMMRTIPVSHAGGIVGKTPFPVRVMNSSAFLNAPRLHKGGLASDETPAILQKGEGVFTQEQMAAMGGGGEISIFNITDPSLIDSWAASSRGKNAILNVIGNSTGRVKRMLR